MPRDDTPLDLELVGRLRRQSWTWEDIGRLVHRSAESVRSAVRRSEGQRPEGTEAASVPSLLPADAGATTLPTDHSDQPDQGGRPTASVEDQPSAGVVEGWATDEERTEPIRTGAPASDQVATDGSVGRGPAPCARACDSYGPGGSEGRPTDHPPTREVPGSPPAVIRANTIELEGSPSSRGSGRSTDHSNEDPDAPGERDDAENVGAHEAAGVQAVDRAALDAALAALREELHAELADAVAEASEQADRSVREIATRMERAHAAHIEELQRRFLERLSELGPAPARAVAAEARETTRRLEAGEQPE